MLGRIGAGLFCHIDILKLFQGARVIDAVTHGGGATAIAAGFGIAQVQALVIGKVRVREHIEQSALAHGDHLRHAFYGGVLQGAGQHPT